MRSAHSALVSGQVMSQVWVSAGQAMPGLRPAAAVEVVESDTAV